MLRVVDAFFLLGIVRLVILRKLDNGAVLLNEDSAAVTGVRTVDVLLGDEDNAASAASVLREILIRHLLVDLHEGVVQSALVVHLLPLERAGQDLHEVILEYVCDFSTAVSVEHANDEAIVAVWQLDILADVLVFHASAPALHAASTPLANISNTVLRMQVRDRCVKVSSHFYK